jgi:hypothetical protein
MSINHAQVQATLEREPSSRLSLLARGILPGLKDAQGAYFIDRWELFGV